MRAVASAVVSVTRWTAESTCRTAISSRRFIARDADNHSLVWNILMFQSWRDATPEGPDDAPA